VRPAADEPRFHPLVAVVALSVVFVFTNIAALIVVSAAGYSGSPSEEMPLWLIGLTELPLWAGYLAVAIIVSNVRGTGHWRRDYGLEFRAVDLWGVPVGALTQLVFVWLLYRLLALFINVHDVDKSARQLTDRASGWGVVILVLIVGVGAPLFEELFFRGLIMRALQSYFHNTLALVGSAVVFAAIHFQLLQFPALMLFGLVAGYCAQRTGRLGMSICAHIGFNMTAVVVFLPS
jgi:membrane protease YdiL (CAAX protease family)